MRIKFSTIIILLIVFLTVQEPILSNLPLPGVITLALRGSVEIFLFGVFGLIILKRIVNNGTVAVSVTDWLALSVLLCAIASMLINHNRYTEAFDNIRALIRFLTIFYIAENIDIEDAQVQKIIMLIGAVGVLEGILSLAQYVSPEINRLFTSRLAYGAAGNIRIYTALKVGAVVGTFGAPAEMALFQCTALITASVIRIKETFLSLFSWKSFLAIALISWGAFATYKRFSLLMILVLFGIILLLRIKKSERMIVISAGMLLVILASIFFASLPSIYDALPKSFTKLAVRQDAFEVSEFVLELFSPQYWTRVFTVSRGWFMLTATEHMLQSDHLLLGYGPDELFARAGLASENFNLQILAEGYRGFEDVYWVAMFVYYGIIGLASLLILLGLILHSGVQLHRYGRNATERTIGEIVIAMIVLAFLYNFAERAFELRSFSFILWLFAGLAANRIRAIKTSTASSIT